MGNFDMKTPENTKRLVSRLQAIADDSDLITDGSKPDGYEPCVVLPEDVNDLPDNLYEEALRHLGEVKETGMLDTDNHELYAILTNLTTYKQE